MQDTGLITSFSIEENGQAHKLDWDGIRDWEPSNGILWVHLDYNHPESIRWLENESNLDSIVIEALSAEETRPRYAVIDIGLLITLRGVNLLPDSEPQDMVAIRIWLEKNRVITTRGRYIRSEDNLKISCMKGQGPVSTPEFLTNLSSHMLSNMSDVIDTIDDNVNCIETDLTDTNISVSQDSLSNLRKKIITLRRHLAPQRDVLLRLGTERIRWFTERDNLYLKEIADIIIRYIEDLDEAKDHISIIQEQILNRISYLANKRMYYLSIIASIFLPLSFITGLLGINVAGIPGATYPYAFGIVALTLLIIGLIFFFILKLKKWM